MTVTMLVRATPAAANDLIWVDSLARNGFPPPDCPGRPESSKWPTELRSPGKGCGGNGVILKKRKQRSRLGKFRILQRPSGFVPSFGGGWFGTTPDGAQGYEDHMPGIKASALTSALSLKAKYGVF